jgi:hypothetical protein
VAYDTEAPLTRGGGGVGQTDFLFVKYSYSWGTYFAERTGQPCNPQVTGTEIAHAAPVQKGESRLVKGSPCDWSNLVLTRAYVSSANTQKPTTNQIFFHLVGLDSPWTHPGLTQRANSETQILSVFAFSQEYFCILMAGWYSVLRSSQQQQMDLNKAYQ